MLFSPLTSSRAYGACRECYERQRPAVLIWINAPGSIGEKEFARLLQARQAKRIWLPSVACWTSMDVDLDQCTSRTAQAQSMQANLEGAVSVQVRMASGTAVPVRKHMRMVVQIGISLIAAAIMVAAALDAVAAHEFIKGEVISGSRLMATQYV